jgi:hypothetical protein
MNGRKENPEQKRDRNLYDKRGKEHGQNGRHESRSRMLSVRPRSSAPGPYPPAFLHHLLLAGAGDEQALLPARPSGLNLWRPWSHARRHPGRPLTQPVLVEERNGRAWRGVRPPPQPSLAHGVGELCIGQIGRDLGTGPVWDRRNVRVLYVKYEKAIWWEESNRSEPQISDRTLASMFPLKLGFHWILSPTCVHARNLNFF